MRFTKDEKAFLDAVIENPPDLQGRWYTRDYVRSLVYATYWAKKIEFSSEAVSSSTDAILSASSIVKEPPPPFNLRYKVLAFIPTLEAR